MIRNVTVLLLLGTILLGTACSTLSLNADGREAMSLIQKARYAEALPLLERSVNLDIEMRSERDLRVLTGLRWLSFVYHKLARYKEGLAVNERRLRLSTEVLGEKHPDTIQCLRDVAISYASAYEDGNARALSLLEKALALRIEVLGERHPDTSSLMTDVANAYWFLGRYFDALDMYERDVRIATAAYGAEDERTLGPLLVLAITYANLGREAEALPIFQKTLQQAIAKQGEKSRDSVFAMVALASSYTRLDRPADALPLMQKAMQLRQEIFPEKDRETIHFLESLANLYIRLGRAEEALPLFAQAVQLYAEDSGARSFVVLHSMNKLARTYGILGQLEEARALHERVLQLRTDVLGPQHPDTILSLVHLARIDQQLARQAEALALYEKVVPAVEALRASGDLSPENRQTLFGQWVDAYKAYAGLLITVGRGVEAFHIAELSKARTLLESTAMRHANQSGLLSEEEHNRVRGFERQVMGLNDQIAAAVSSTERRFALEAEKNRVLADFAVFRRELAVKYPKYAQLSDVRILDAEEGRAVLPGNALLLSYLIEGDTPIVFTLSAQGLTARVLEAIPHLAQTIDAYRRLISHPLGAMGLRLDGESVWNLVDGSYLIASQSPAQGASQVNDTDDIARYLGEKLLDPVAEQLREAKKVIISPDGSLAALPFETLSVGNIPLVADHDVSYVQSLSMLALLKARDEEYRQLGARMDLLAMGGAIYQLSEEDGTVRRGVLRRRKADSSVNLRLLLARGTGDVGGAQPAFDALQIEWPNLPGTEKEVANVTQVFGVERSIAFIRGDATESKLLQLNSQGSLANYRYLLFSAHGYLSMEEPALSSLVLGQVNKAPGTDGYVTAAEWPGYDLKSDLTVLSACDTGLGKVVQGEGVMGLSYALYVAGNKNTLLSLWPVLDESTAEFMTAFFSKLKAGAAQVEALNITKREFISGIRFSRPVYWAPFVLYGF